QTMNLNKSIIILCVILSFLLNITASATHSFALNTGNTPMNYNLIQNTKPLPINQNIIEIDRITLDNQALSLEIGQTATISATVSPFNAPISNLVWAPSQMGIIFLEPNFNTVRITALQPGTVTVTALTGNRSSEACIVTVKAPSSSSGSSSSSGPTSGTNSNSSSKPVDRTKAADVTLTDIYKEISDANINANKVIRLMKSGTKVEASVFDLMKRHPNTVVEFRSEKYDTSLEFKGSELFNPYPINFIGDLKPAVLLKTPNQKAIEWLYTQVPPKVVYIHIEQPGPLPGKAILTAKIGDSFRNREVFVYYHNPYKDKIELIAKNVPVNQLGVIKFYVNKGSDYIVSPILLEGDNITNPVQPLVPGISTSPNPIDITNGSSTADEKWEGNFPNDANKQPPLTGGTTRTIHQN
ncbi:MAG: Ig-like domain-containing protein, partial [Oscillospiraceae bacterium]